MELINETEIFTEALVASVAVGEITVDQLKKQLEAGLAYVAAQDDGVEEELVIALAALDKAIWRVTGSVWQACNQTPILVSAHSRKEAVS